MLFKQKKFFLLFAILVSAFFFNANLLFSNEFSNEIDLSGEWGFKFGGYSLKKINPKPLPETVLLPGSLDENQKGEPTDPNDPNEKKLSRKFRHTGVVTFQKEVFIPNSFANKTINLFMERTRVTRVWVNGHEVTDARRNLLIVPDIYNITEFVQLGQNNTITITSDNSYKTLGYFVPEAILGSHFATEESQTNWNGIVGRFVIEAKEKTYIDSVRVIPKDDLKSVKVAIDIQNREATPFNGTLQLQVREQIQELAIRIPAQSLQTVNVDTFSIDTKNNFWDEFSPNLLTMKATLSNGDSKSQKFGMRKFEVNSKSFRLTNNGRTLFFRGEANCGVFPKTGYAPMDKESWRHLFTNYQRYGINAVRFHSWCPGEAAFEVADELGLFMWVETTHWTGKKTNDNLQYIEAQAKAILKEYANHPSFVILGYCNEPNQKHKQLNQITPKLKKIDESRCYFLGTSPNGLTAPESNDQIFTNGAFRGSASGNRGFCYNEVPSSSFNHNQVIEKLITKEKLNLLDADTAFIGHEVGQYQVFPNYNYELPLYKDCVLTPRNLVYWKQKAVEAGLEAVLDDYTVNSGEISRLCYRLEVEAALRTPGQSGVSLLGIQDFPGYGTALVGMMDVFANPKGNADGVYDFAKPERFKQFLDAVVPMLEMERFTWHNNEALKGNLLVANYGEGDIQSDIEILLKEKKTDKVLDKKVLEDCFLKQGILNELGKYRFDFADITKPVTLTAQITIKKINKTNEYDLWVYPTQEKVEKGAVVVAEKLDETVYEALEAGKSVLLMPEATKEHFPKSKKGVFPTNFWSGSRYINWGGGGGAGTMGIMVDPKHPLFKNFPTESYSNYQWGAIAMNGRPMELTHLKAGLKPIVTVMDDYASPDLMGTLFEVQMGKGKLMVCSMGLNQIEMRYPEAKQMKKAILDYMNSDAFNPKVVLDKAELRQIVLDQSKSQNRKNKAVLKKLTLIPKGRKTTIKVGEKLKIEVRATPLLIKNPEVIWHVEDEGYPESPAIRAKITDDGVVTGEIAGNIILTATSTENEKIVAKCYLTIEP